MASPKPQVSCSAASMCEESSVVQVSDSSETLAHRDSPVQVLNSFDPLALVTTAAVTADVVCSSPPPEQSPGHFSFTLDTAAITVDVAERLPLPPHQSSAGPSVAQEAQLVAGPSRRRTHLYVVQIKSQWNLRQVFTELGTQEDCIRFCEEQGLIPATKTCSYHKRPMKLSTAASHGQLGLFRCTKSNCRTKPVSRAQGTWFENVHLALTIVFQMMYLFSHGATYDDVQRETSLKTGPVVSTKTIADWYSYCRETIIIFELENQIYETKIGGPNKIVQIDESKFGKRKYNRGRNIEGHWVLGMIENDSDDLRLEVCPNNERSAEVLVPLIQKHVAEGSIIHTNFWRAYDCLPEYGYIHKKKVNHSDQDNRFVAPDGKHTQRIESHWRELKRQFQKDQYKGNFVDWLAEFSWRRKNRIYNKDPFEELLKAIKYVYRLD